MARGNHPLLRLRLSNVLTAVAPKPRYGASRKRKVPSISQHGNVSEIIGKCGGADQVRDAVSHRQSLLYAG